ncbi:fructan beta-fructosidase [Pseudobutyrivibrio sp. ACV-2]|uniref:GH32 C-terminal domain-containing protein n=1 Tax=Pseudobutyrivibrio sp. ACV-2 TaxID=1520801 RepID=UPI00089BB021|nr:GH32 C-terminal domain-containing protein [Pseudobutyrivibrio sp. ACV-2]SEA83284.1 fructan beta-fructosidase [Pseudobutyrivibrio sp. ACV-2]
MHRRRLVRFLCKVLGVSLVFCNVVTNNATVFATSVVSEEITNEGNSALIEELRIDESSDEEDTSDKKETAEEEKSEKSKAPESKAESEEDDEKGDDLTSEDEKEIKDKKELEDDEKLQDEEALEDEEELEDDEELDEDEELEDDEDLDDEKNSIEKSKKKKVKKEIKKEENYKNNIGELTYAGEGTWEATEDGMLSDAIDKGDCFAFSKTKGRNFVYSTEVKFLENRGAAALLFRSNGTADDKESYVVNIDASNHKCKFFRWQRNDALQLIDEKSVPATEDETYELKVVAYDSWILYYVNDQLVASTGDYYLQPGDLGQDTYIDEGVFGLLNWNSKVIYQNTYFKELNDDFLPILENIKITSDNGTVQKKARFVSTEPMMLQYVDNDASEINVEVEKACENATIEVKDENGTVYEDGRHIPVKQGINYLTVKSTVKDDDYEASVVYRINVHRLKPAIEYYNEVYRDQYHYSVKEGWANDPNGLVYYNGKYHLFYQFFDDIKWGPMHWAHATSEDLIHWTDEPIAFYPDANGAMFSGCIVADTNNSSGLFDSENGGLVALITADGNGQRIKVAYSEDEGKTWKKLDKVAADWTNDPLHSRDFRDPKVFRWENKWFMVVAGGPLRIYSSDNLLNWKCESTYPDLHTECPDLYPVEAEDGTLKWVLSRGGRFYKVGDLVNVDGNWTYVPDAEYVDRDGIMNFGRDSYAAMTYYVQDFGTAENPVIPEIVELNWMNTWDDYCNSVAAKTGQDFNGTFNLNLALGLEKTGDTYSLTQTPVEQYKSLRDKSSAIHLKDKKVTDDSDLLKDFSGDTYEICATFKPEAGTNKVGFKLRKGADEETVVAYDLASQKLYIDRSKSGIIISGKFAEVCSQDMSLNEDGTVDLHIYVDKASVEVFSSDDKVCGAAQIFPNPFSLGLEVFVEGAAAKADIDIYPLESIWGDKQSTDEAYAINSMFPKKTMMNCGEEAKIDVYILPVSANQEIEWSIQSGEDYIELSQNGKIKALKKGKAIVVATSKANPELTREFNIEVYENNFKTNMKEFVNLSGNWSVDDETLTVSNVAQNDYYMTKDKISGDYTLKTKIAFKKGLINIFLVGQNMNPLDGEGAYSIQFAPDNLDIRLFRFGRDDMYRGRMSKAIGDGKYHDIEIVKKDTTVSVLVDNENSLEYTIDGATDMAEGYVGLGLWDGELNVQTFYVDYEGAENPSSEEPAPQKPDVEEPAEKPSEQPSTENQKKEVPTPNQTDDKQQTEPVKEDSPKAQPTKTEPAKNETQSGTTASTGTSSSTSSSTQSVPSQTTAVSSANESVAQVTIPDSQTPQALPGLTTASKSVTKASTKQSKPASTIEKTEETAVENVETNAEPAEESVSEEIKDTDVPKAGVNTDKQSADESPVVESSVATATNENSPLKAVLAVIGVAVIGGVAALSLRKRNRR